MVLKKNSRQILFYLLIAYVFFTFLMPLSSVMVGLLCVLTFLAVLFLNDSDVLCFLAFSACFAGGTGFKTIFLTLFTLVMVFMLIKKFIFAIKLKNKKTVRFILIILCATVILLTYGLIVTKGHFYKFSQSIGLILVFTNLYLLDKVCIKRIVQVLAVGLIVSSAISVLSYISGLYMEIPFAYDSITGIRFQAYFTNVNALAMYCSLCQTAILALFIVKSLDVKRWLPILIIITGIGFLTFSKTFVLLTLFAYLATAIIGFIKSDNKKRYFKLLIIALIIVTLLALVFNKYIIKIVERFLDTKSYSGGVLNTATTGRVDIWKSYIDKWTSSPLYILFGCGITADNINERTAHNLYISILYKFGIVGVVAIVACLVWVLKNKQITQNVAKYLPLVLIMINGLSEDITCSMYTSFPILLVLLFILRCNKDKSKEE